MNTVILWAPDDSYARAKHLEEGPSPSKTGDSRFDATYLLRGNGAVELSRGLPAGVREILLVSASIHPEVKWQELTSLRERLHVHAQPPLQNRHKVPGPSLGEALFTTECATVALQRAVELAERIENA